MRCIARNAIVLVLALLFVTRAEASKKPVNETRALKIADQVLCQLYGRNRIDSERPLKAELIGNTWFVHGSMPELSVGGVAQIWIDGKSGRVVKIKYPK